MAKSNDEKRRRLLDRVNKLRADMDRHDALIEAEKRKLKSQKMDPLPDR